MPTLNKPATPTPSTGRRRAWTGTLIVGFAVVYALGQAGLQEPPRFDGAGYATLAEALARGDGYRSIDHPERPPHVNFPPAYPVVLALIRRTALPTIPAYHLFSLVCSVAATCLALTWFRGQFPRHAASLLSLALATNWIWARTAAEIQSEPFYLLLQMLTLVVSSRLANQSCSVGFQWSALLGLLLGLAMLTRQVGLVLLAAVILSQVLRRAWSTAAVAAGLAILTNIPWVVWQARHPQKKQIAYFLDRDPLAVVLENAVFYVRRIPDMLSGPFVEVATVFQPQFSTLATAAATVASLVVIGGWLVSLQSARRRLGSLLGLGSITLLLAWPFTEAGRFLIPLIPVLLAGSCEGLARLLRGFSIQKPRVAAAGLLLLAALPYSTYALLTSRAAAQRARHIPFDNACAWIASQTNQPGPLMTAYPGEAFLQTGRVGIAVPPGANSATIDALIEEQNVAYLLIAPHRFANPPDNPLTHFVAAHPERVALAWGKPGDVAVYRVLPRASPATTHSGPLSPDSSPGSRHPLQSPSMGSP